MNILLMSNTYKPLVGGLEKSIINFSTEFRSRGHQVVIVAPEFPDMEIEKDVIRIPAMTNFNGSDFSVQLPNQGTLDDLLGDFKPHLVHSQHPFLVGDTALRIASKYHVPLVFTHHSLYEENVTDQAIKRFVTDLATGYANLSDYVFAPSESIKQLIIERGVTTPIEVVPTGIDVKMFATGAKKAMRERLGIPQEAFVIGHVGRLAPEKNLEFLTRAIAGVLKKDPTIHCLIGGSGPSEEEIKLIMTQEGVINQYHLAGVLKGKDLVDAYHAMDVFAFSSHSETQGLVITEAMAAGIPVVAVDAPGVREVVRDGINGCLLLKEDKESFQAALLWVKNQSAYRIKLMKEACNTTAQDFDLICCASRALNIYSLLVVKGFAKRNKDYTHWSEFVRTIKVQWGLAKNLTHATGALLSI